MTDRQNHRPNRSRALALMGASQVAEPTTVRLTGPIGEHGGIRARSVKAAILSGRGQLRLIIDSPGGLVAEAVEIYEALRNLDRPIVATVHRECSSAANIVLMAAVHRRAPLNARFLLHGTELPPGGSARWTARRHAARASVLGSTDQQIVSIIARASGTAPERLAAELSTERTMTALQALSAGILTEVVGVSRPPSREWLARVRAVRSSGQPVSLSMPSYLFSPAYLSACEVTQ